MEWRAAAEILCAQSRYADAEKLYDKVLSEREHAMGLNNPALVEDLNDLGRVDFAMTKYEQAASNYERALQIMETAKGRGDIATVPALNKLARIYQTLERYSEAEQFARRGVSAVEKNKADSPELIAELTQLGDLLSLQKKYQDAESVYDHAVREGGQSVSVDLLPALDGLAAADLADHKLPEAEIAWRHALSIRESVYGPSTLEVAGTLDKLGEFYFSQKKYPEAGYCYERSLFIRSKFLGDNSPDTQATLGQIANVYGAQGRQGDAEPLYREMLDSKELDTVTSLNALAALLASHDKNSEAESLYKLSIALLDKHGFVTARRPVVNKADPPSPLLAETLDQYAALLRKVHKKSEAAKMEARARILHGNVEADSLTSSKSAK